MRHGYAFAHAGPAHGCGRSWKADVLRAMRGGEGWEGGEGRERRGGEGRGGHRGFGHHGGRPGGPGFGPGWGGPPWGPWGRGGLGPGGPGGRGGRRRKRGDVRAALLLLLAEEARNGYGLMQEIERRSEGLWRPSPGSVYPALQQLEDEGLVRAEEQEGGSKLFHLTDAGREHVDANREKLGEPWADLSGGEDDPRRELQGLVAQVGMAVMQVGTAGDEAQVQRAKELLTETRRSLYRILAEDEEGGAEA